MQAVILAGGKGTRLRPLTDTLPKPMVPLLDKPVLEYILLHLKETGIEDILLTVGYRKDAIIDYFGTGEPWGVHLTYVSEEVPLGTAGSVKNCYPLLDEHFFVLSGDGYCETDFKNAFAFHLAKRSPCTILARPHPYPEGLGTLTIDFENLITDFCEKPEEMKPSLVNTGIYILKKEILHCIPSGFYDFGKNLFPRLVQKCYAYIDYAYWSDIGTLPAYYETNKYLAEKYLQTNSVR